ncbi:unnamed protein product [Prunus armeniaca]
MLVFLLFFVFKGRKGKWVGSYGFELETTDLRLNILFRCDMMTHEFKVNSHSPLLNGQVKVMSFVYISKKKWSIRSIMFPYPRVQSSFIHIPTISSLPLFN